MGVVIIIILALIISVAINVMQYNRKNDKKPEQSVRSTILSGIQNVCELATIRENFQSIVMFSSSKKIPFLDMNLPGTTKKFMLKYQGTIVCGCDLTKAKVSEPYEGNKVRITVPECEVLDAYPDIHSYEVYDQRSGIFTSVKLEDQNREVCADLERIKTNEVNAGILAQSNENVKKILTSVAASSGMLAEVIFTGKDNPAISPQNQNLKLEAKVINE